MKDSTVTILVELSIEEANLAEFSRLMGEMLKSIADEPGTLAYEWMLSADRRTVHLYERYADTAALLSHLAGFIGNHSKSFLALSKPTRVLVYARPDAEVRAALAGFSPVYLTPQGGFHR